MNPDHRHSVLTFPTPEALAEAAADRVVGRMLAHRGPVAICLTGGSSPHQLYRLLGSDSYGQRIPWERVHWFIGDERFVPDRDPLHNMAVARRLLLDGRAPASHTHPIPTDLSDPDQAARVYESELQAFYGDSQLVSSRPLFDVVMLGLGPDGHVASLFPMQSTLDEATRWTVGVPEAPVSPFVPRVTLTLPALNSCAEMLFLVAGKEKRGILSRVLAGEDLPANRCRATGQTIWLVDQAAHPDDVIECDSVPCGLVVMGVSGSGKSTIGEELGRRLGWPYEDADTFHPATNVAKLRAGHPLTDDDRRPWLQAVAHEIERVCRTRGHIVMACSALKRHYRRILAEGNPDVRFIYLDGTRELIAKRLSGRHHSFMPAELLQSQFDALEPPGADENPVIVSIDAPVDRIVSEIIGKLGLGSGSAGA